MMIATLLTVAALFAPGDPAPKTACVAADSVKVRALASADEPVIGRFRIGTRVFVRETKADGWTRIEAGPLKGWTIGKFLAPDCPTLEDLVSRSMGAVDPAEAVRWADRALTLDPFAPEAHLAAEAAYKAAKITDRVKLLALKEMKEGRTAIFLAMCVDGEAIVAGQVKPSGLEALLTSTEMLPPASEYEKLLPALAATSWYSLSPDGTPDRIEGTPFPAPAAVSEGLGHIRLGACTIPGMLYATAPVKPAGSLPMGDAANAATADALLALVAPAAVGSAGGFTQTRFDAGFFEGVKARPLGSARVELTPQSGEGDAIGAWALIDKGTIIETVGFLADAKNYDRVTHVAVVSVSGGRKIAVIAHEVGDRAAAGAGRRFTLLLIPAKGALERADLALESGSGPE